MRKKNVSIADFEGFFIECENDIALNNHFNDLTKIRIKNLELINKSMRNLDIKSLPFTKKEFNTFLSMTELVEHIFGENIEFLKSEIHNLNNQLCSSRSNESRHIHHIMKLQSDIFDLERKNKKLSEEKSMLRETNKNYKKIICQLENKLRNLKVNNIETNNQTQKSL